MVFLYSSAGNDFFCTLKHRLNGGVSSGRLESYTRLDDLFHRLRQPRMNLEIGVFAITDPAELEGLLTVRELLTDMRLLLALADDDPQTLFKAHALAPRFITFLDNGIAPLVSVVKRMMAVNTINTFPNELSLAAVDG